jgi:hypothetical protein
MSKSKALSNVEQEMALAAQQQAAAERPSLSTISLRGGIMQYMEEPVPGNTMDCIVVAHVHENAWYEGDWDPDNLVSPNCFALGVGDAEAMVPHEDVPEPVCANCVECPKHEWGSDPKGGRGKACKTKRRLAILPAGGGDEMALMKLPVTSVKGWGKYVNQIATMYARPPWGVITTIKVKPHAKYQFTVEFEFKALVDDAEVLGGMMKREEEAVAILMQPFDISTDEEEGSNKY